MPTRLRSVSLPSMSASNSPCGSDRASMQRRSLRRISIPSAMDAWLRISDLDDFIGPSVDCIKPVQPDIAIKPTITTAAAVQIEIEDDVVRQKPSPAFGQIRGMNIAAVTL